MIAISPTTATVPQGKTQTFTASGGTGPYVFSVKSGLGSINSSTGVYTASRNTGIAVVEVVDSLGARARAGVTICSALTLICDIIKTSMELESDQVFLWDQKFNIPDDQRLYVTIGILSCKPFANTREYVPITGGLEELLSVNMQATLSVDIFSRGPDARDRKEEILLALGSTYSQQQQERFGFYVAPIPNGFVNLSAIEGAAIPYRFNISVNVQYQISKTPSVDYYDDFTDSLLVDA